MSTAVPRIPASLADWPSRSPVCPRTTATRVPVISTRSQSLSVNGQYRLIVVNRGTLTGRPNEILAGNQPHLQGGQAAWGTDVAVTFLDVDDDAAAKIVIVDNRTSDLAGYATVLLADILTELPDLDGTGYDQDRLDLLLDETALPAPIELPSDGADTGAAAKVHRTCRNWQFAWWLRTNRDAPDARPLGRQRDRRGRTGPADTRMTSWSNARPLKGSAAWASRSMGSPTKR